MERSQKLKLLYKETKILFDKGIDAATAYDLLSSEKLFGKTIQFDVIQYLYRKLQEKVASDIRTTEIEKKQENLNTEFIRLCSELDNVEIQIQQAINENHSLNSKLEPLGKEFTRLNNDLGDLEIQIQQASNEHRNLQAKRVCLTSEYYELKPCRQNAKKHLIYSGKIMNFNAQSSIFWQGRYALEFSYNATVINHKFHLFDLYHQKSEYMSIPHIGFFIKFHALTDKFILVIEKDVHEDNVCYLSLMKFEPTAEVLQLIQRVKYQSRHIKVYVDSADTKKFITMQDPDDNGQHVTQICTLVDGQIQINKEIVWQHSDMSSYFDGQLLSFIPGDNNIRLRARIRDLGSRFYIENASIRVFNLDQGTSKSLRIRSFPQNIEFELLSTGLSDIYNYAWVRNRFFLSIKFSVSGNFGFVVADSETCKWSIFDTAFKLPIQSIQFVNGSDLMVHTGRYHYQLTKIYKIPIRKPDRLRCMAWRKLIEMTRKTTDANDLYYEASHCLPFNTDVRPFRFIK